MRWAKSIAAFVGVCLLRVEALDSYNSNATDIAPSPPPSSESPTGIVTAAGINAAIYSQSCPSSCRSTVTRTETSPAAIITAPASISEGCPEGCTDNRNCWWNSEIDCRERCGRYTEGGNSCSRGCNATVEVEVTVTVEVPVRDCVRTVYLANSTATEYIYENRTTTETTTVSTTMASNILATTPSTYTNNLTITEIKSTTTTLIIPTTTTTTVEKIIYQNITITDVETTTASPTYPAVESSPVTVITTESYGYPITQTDWRSLTITETTSDVSTFYTTLTFGDSTMPYTTIVVPVYITAVTTIPGFSTTCTCISGTTLTYLDPGTTLYPYTETQTLPGSLTTITLPGGLTTIIGTDTAFETVSATTTTTTTKILPCVTSTITTNILGSLTTITVTGTETLPPVTETLPPVTQTLPGTTVVTTEAGIPTTVVLPGAVTTLPGVETTVTNDVTVPVPTTLYSTLPGIVSVVTLSGSLTTVTGPESVVTLPGAVTTLPGQVTTVTSLTTLPGVVTTVSGQVTTISSEIISIVTIITSTTTTLPGVTTTRTLSSVHTVTPVSVCPVPPGIPAPATTQPLDFTWGCGPGTVCSPAKPAGCDVFSGPPPANYICQPSECIPAPKFTPVIWPEDKTSYYPLPVGYFDLSPLAFGLSYDIFAADVIVEYGLDNQPLTTVTTGNWQSQASITEAYTVPTSSAALARRKRWEEALPHPNARLSRRASSTVPAVCFATCNNCLVVAQATGKTAALCDSTSAFQGYLAACRQCVVANGDATQATLQRYVAPQFAQFLGFCDVLAAQSVVVPSVVAQSAVTGAPDGVSTQMQETADTRTDVLTISGGGGEVVTTSTMGEVVVTRTQSEAAGSSTRTSVVGMQTTRTVVETPVETSTRSTSAGSSTSVVGTQTTRTVVETPVETSSASSASASPTAVVNDGAPRLGQGVSALVGFLLAVLMVV